MSKFIFMSNQQQVGLITFKKHIRSELETS